MATQIVYEIKGLREVLRKCDPQILAQPLKNFFQRAAITIQNRARQNAPVDTGRLRSSIATQVDAARPPSWAKAGTNVEYARPMEFGTGSWSEDPESSHTPHWPPGAALDTWARRHGFGSGFQVAAAIGKRGGLKPRRYLRNAMRDSLHDIQGFLERLGKEIQVRGDGK